MRLPWYCLVLYIAVGSLLLWILDKFQIIKSKPLRYFILILVYTPICWFIYDLLETA
jgi:hypothetical protein